jgi:hypothetical protein
MGTPAWAAEPPDLWALLKAGGQVVVMHHASTDPGVGDLPDLRLEDCATQRNLSAAGREEARRIGEAFRARGVPIGDLLSSRWCRCLETARLAFGRVEPWPPLDSFFRDRGRDAAQHHRPHRLVPRPGGDGGPHPAGRRHLPDRRPPPAPQLIARVGTPH